MMLVRSRTQPCAYLNNYGLDQKYPGSEARINQELVILARN